MSARVYETLCFVTQLCEAASNAYLVVRSNICQLAQRSRAKSRLSIAKRLSVYRSLMLMEWYGVYVHCKQDEMEGDCGLVIAA